jgi:hypothetical protein
MRRCLFALGLLILAVIAAPAFAAVERVEVQSRVPFADGERFGDVGPYEKIRGVAWFALDPDAAANASIVDLKRAPRDARGRVVFKSEFVMLRPAHAAASTLLYDVNNRGGIAILGQVNGRSPANNDPTTAADAGDGFLMRHGFTLLFSAWTWDVAPQPPGVRPLVFAPPVAKGPGGAAITGPVENEFTVTAPAAVTTYAGMRGLTYEPATPDDPLAVLTVRARPDDARRPLPRAAWRFVAPEQAGGPGRIRLDGGFQPGVIYDLTYTAKDPYVTGAGLAGIRDLLAWFKTHPFEGAPAPRTTLIFGISQSGRVIGRMLHDGLDVDETGRLAFDGAFLQVPGGGGGAGFNSRFAQPTRHPSMLEEHDYPSDAFPFTTAPARDPVTGAAGSSLERARDAHGRVPKLIYANTSTEFWNRDASLIATTPNGAADVAPAPNARLYAFMGAQHYVGRSRERAPYVNCVSTSDHYLPLRALILALERWSAGGAPPPPSAYPRLTDGTLTTVEAYRAAFPQGLPIAPPAQALAEPRLDFGPRFASAGIARPPPTGPRPALWFARAGPRRRRQRPRRGAAGRTSGAAGHPHRLEPARAGNRLRLGHGPFDGSFLPFARTEAERLAAHDPRPSLAARYPTRAAYLAQLRAAIARQIAAGFLLPEDAARAEAENVGLYDRILAHDPGDASCGYLFGG